MKKCWIFWLVLVIGGTAVAHDQDNNNSNLKETIDKSTTDSEREDQIIFDINHDRLLDLPDGVDLSPFSRGVNIHLMYDVPIAGQNVSFAIGGGFSSSNYFLNAGIVEVDTTDGQTYSTFVEIPDSTYKRNKLSANYLEVPVEFRFRTNENAKGNRVKVAVGAKLGRVVNFHSKTIAENGDRFKTYVFPNVNDWRYGVTGRIGYGKVTLSGFYSLVPLFESGRGQEVTPISIGISIIPF